MNAVVVLQARTNSSRLPAKVMLPLGGMPMVVLAARRAGNTGLRVLVATSTSPDDNALASLLGHYGIECFRGSLDDVLGRFVSALNDLDDQTVVIRLTADNPFPDGALLDEVLEDFRARKLRYLACNGAPCGVPYGLSAEVVELGLLREANRKVNTARDREHVTPYAIRMCGLQWFEKYRGLGKGHFRCTVDDYDDYQCLLHVFADERDPIGAPAMRLVSQLESAPFQPYGNAPVTELVVGGAQLGMDYGINNQAGAPTLDISAAMLKCAISNGTGWIDTAYAYGDSENQIGQALSGGWATRARVVTKLSPLVEMSESSDLVAVRASVDASIFGSCARLRRTRLDAVLLHRTAHLDAWGGAAWQRLRELALDGTVAMLGVSVQNPTELKRAIQEPDVGIIQMPFNIMDWRWESAVEDLIRARASRSITVHVRSTLLQGLLASRDRAQWQQANESKPEPVWDWLSTLVKSFGRLDVVDLCFAYVRSQSWVDGVVVGMETLEQVRENIRYFLAPPLDAIQCDQLLKARPKLSEGTLDPSRWSAA